MPPDGPLPDYGRRRTFYASVKRMQYERTRLLYIRLSRRLRLVLAESRALAKHRDNSTSG